MKNIFTTFRFSFLLLSFFLLLCLSFTPSVLGQDLYSLSGGDATLTTTWSFDNCFSTQSVAGVIPSNSTPVTTICAGEDVFIPIGGFLEVIDLEIYGGLTLQNNATLIVNGNLTIHSGGILTTTNNTGDNFDFIFRGNITNNATFRLRQSSHTLFETTPLSITNNSGNMRFSESLGSGTCQIDTDVIINNGTGDEIQLWGNGGININGTLTNNNTTGVLAPNFLTGGGSFQNNGRLIMRSNILSDVANFNSSSISTFEYNYAGDGDIRGGVTYGTLEITGTGVKTLQAGTTTILGDLDNNTGNSFNTTTNATVVIFDGTTPQTIRGITTTFYGLEISNPAHVTFDDFVQVNNSLDLDDGKVILTSDNFRYNGTDANLTHTPNSWIQATTTSRKFLRNSGSATFPVGDASNKQTVFLSNVNTGTGVSFINPSTISSPNNMGSWHIGASLTTDIEFQAPQGAGLTNSSLVHIESAGNWSPITPTSFTSPNYRINNYTGGAGEFTIFTPPSNAFITKWKSDNPSGAGTNSQQVRLPIVGGSYFVYWEEDGNAANNSGGQLGPFSGSQIIDFGTIGIYRVEISGTYDRIVFNNGGDRRKILTIEQWGDNAWTNMNNAFYGCSNLTYNATDAPDLSSVPIMNLGLMFAECPALVGNSSISTWVTDNVTDMRFMFSGATLFNQNIGSWNVGSVTNMEGMFQGSQNFNQNLSSWVTTNVNNMNRMFNGATVFNNGLSSGVSASLVWNTSNVANMQFMFQNATAFNQNVSSWNVSNVSNMANMFAGASAFNQDIRSWNTSSVVFMGSMFNNATSFNNGEATNGSNNPLTWNTSSVTDMNYMFYNASTFNQDIGVWNTQNVQNMAHMFDQAVLFNQDIGSWNTQNVLDMNSMFRRAELFNNGALSNTNSTPLPWNTSSVLNMDAMFFRANSFNQNIGGWSTSNVTTMENMFNLASVFDQDLSAWDISSITIPNSMEGMLNGTIMSQTNYENTLIGWATIVGPETIPTGITLGVNGRTYCSTNAITARSELTSAPNNWTINGDALASPTCLPSQPIGNRGMYFDGIDDYVDVGTGLNSTFNFSNFTIESWIKINSAENGIVSNRPSNANNGASLAVNGGRVKFTLQGIAGGDIQTSNIPAELLENNKWYHIAATYDGSNAKIYVNGVEKANVSITGFSSSSSSLLIGRTYFDNSASFISTRGQIDEVRIFNSVRNAVQIQADMGSNTPNGALGYWNFENGENQIAFNSGSLFSAADGQLGSDALGDINDPLWALRVKNTNDSGAESFREVIDGDGVSIDGANQLAGKNYIDFSIPTSDANYNSSTGVWTIQSLAGITNAISDEALIDGYSAFDSKAATNLAPADIKIQLAAPPLPIASSTLTLSGSSSISVKGLSIQQSEGSGLAALWLSGTAGHFIEGNHIGVDAAGIASYPATPTSGALVMQNSSNNTIGGTSPASRNIISGSSTNGVRIDGTSSNNTILGNYIGVGADGTTPLANGGNGIFINTTGINNNIGNGTIAGQNIIANNTSLGINVTGGATQATISYNSIYLNGSGGINIATGSNADKQAPVVDTATPSLISGTCELSTDIIEVFDNNPSETQGRTYLGNATVAGTTWTFSSGTFTTNNFITATATATDGTNAGNTSSFSNAEPVVSAPEIEVRHELYAPANEILSGSSASGYTIYGGMPICSGNVQKHFRIYNTGTIDLEVSNIIFTGANPTDYSISPSTTSITITPGSFHQFSIQFAPTAVGTRTAIINISNNDSDEATYTFDIEGTGTADTTDPVTPTLTDITAECSATPTAPTTTDNCAGTIIGTTTTTFPITTQGITLVTWTFDDGNGNIITADQNVIINDVTAPVPDLTSLSDVTAECQVTSLVAPTATDNCATTVTVTNDAALPISGEGTNVVVTWTYDDGNGNTSTQTQNVIIDDVTAPVPDLTSLPDVTAECQVTSLVAPTATDNCATTVTVTNDAALPISGEGTNVVVTWTYDDGNGNTSTQTQNVIIDDVTDPTITAPSNVTVNTDATLCTASSVSLGTPTGTDNCGTVTFSNDAPSEFTIGSTVVTWTADDGNGNTAIATQTITVTDNELPITTSISSITVSPNQGCTFYNENNQNPSYISDGIASDNCGIDTNGYEYNLTGATVTTIPVFTLEDLIFNEGITTVTWRAKDINGNFSSPSEQFTVTVIDNAQPPILTAMRDFTRNTDLNNCYYTNRTTTTSNRIPDGTAADNCGVASYRYLLSGVTLGDVSSLEGIRFNQGITDVTWTATDRNGNTSAPNQFTITIIDNKNPFIQAPQDVTKLTNLYGCTSTRDSLDIGTPLASDNCLFRVFNNAPAEFPLGETIVTWTAIDSAGNTATDEQVVTIEEQYYVTPSDSLILVQMYNEMGGASWNNPWDLNTPVSTWNGIRVSCGEVASINLFSNNLTGTLPYSVLNLARRTNTDFSLNIKGNRLSFESAEDFVGAIPNFTYSPQAKIYAPRTEIVGQTESITFNSQTQGNFNTYQWYKDENPIAGATNWEYTIPSALPSDAGIYTCKVSNTVATQLILERNPINLQIEGFVEPTDSLALVQLFLDTGGETSWTQTWDLTQPVSTWSGVTLSGSKITELDLSSRNLIGTLPNVFDAELFSELRYLSFFDNKLEGQIPASIGNITTLTYLDLDKNNFEGSVPVSFGNLINLQALWLSRNNLTSIPEEIGNMSNLRTLYLNDNQFVEVPQTIKNLRELNVLNVSDNQLKELPSSITNLTKLIAFYANRNYIRTIPTDVQNLVSLVTFEINTNHLSSLPSGFLQLSNLSELRVSENELEFDDLLPFSNQNYSTFEYAPQALINQEENILAILNSSLSFVVETQGSGNNYQWFKNGNSIAATQNITLNRISNNDVGIYTAQVTNSSLPDLTLQRRSITLNVECQAGLNFEIKQPIQTVFCESQPFGLKLEIATQFTDAQKITWRKEGVILAFANENSYTVTNAGTYTAEVLTANGCTALSNSVEITVLPQPEISIDLVNEEILTSTLNSLETVTYQWLKDGVPIENAFESTYKPIETAEYSLLVSTETGCSSISEIIIFTKTITAIEEPKELRNLEIFPNPNNGNFFIDFGTASPNGEPTFILIDAIGRKVVLKTEQISSSRYKVKTTNLVGGMYHLQIQTKDGLAFRKFIIEE
ncbi:BspA family leucine-rich repeat surface protein [Bernardetia sp. Wsw4-3y2]|uniref:BspA family leucine-rich repeat surface protein n=1 Tax=Bernardetia sp. Wsw4-3y2 TaxID=3127471 RepID=UPI0030D5ADE1